MVLARVAAALLCSVGRPVRDAVLPVRPLRRRGHGVAAAAALEHAGGGADPRRLRRPVPSGAQQQQQHLRGNLHRPCGERPGDSAVIRPCQRNCRCCLLQNVDQSETLYVSTHADGIYRHWPLQSSSNYNYQGVNLLKFGWAPGVLGNASVDETESFAYNVNGPSGACLARPPHHVPPRAATCAAARLHHHCSPLCLSIGRLCPCIGCGCDAGLLNQSQCEWGAEVFISKPRFYQTDPPLWKNIDGMPAPTAENDDVYLGVEPVSRPAACMRAHPLRIGASRRGAFARLAHAVWTRVRASILAILSCVCACSTRARRWTSTGASASTSSSAPRPLRAPVSRGGD